MGRLVAVGLLCALGGGFFGASAAQDQTTPSVLVVDEQKQFELGFVAFNRADYADAVRIWAPIAGKLTI